ncbi:MAG: hypothetical protein HZB51_25020 [Chloroflexi bacterium]|nr:hypothetical protein [Chloroflexota bacterium]
MSQSLSRRDFFAQLASPLKTIAKRVAANEQRTRNLQALKQAEADHECAKCRLPFQANDDDERCPACRDVETKNRDLMQSLFKPK